MDFLSKKSWHPSRIQNVEKVWKKEQEAIAEQQKMRELQRKLEEERQIEDLKRVQDASGHYKYVLYLPGDKFGVIKPLTQ